MYTSHTLTQNQVYILTVFLPVDAHLSEVHDVAGQSAYIGICIYIYSYRCI